MNWVLALFGSVACGQTSQPAALSAGSSADQILNALDARGKNLQDFKADVALTVTDEASGSSTINSGTVIFQRKGLDDGRIRINFTKKQVEDRILPPIDHQYTLENGLLDDRDYKKATETRTQVLQPGQKLNLFKLGEGPFPLPLGQKKEDVYANFRVEKIGPDGGDPAETVHLRLTPKGGTRFARQYKTIDLWVDVISGMPRRIETANLDQSESRTTDLTDVQLNSGVSDKDFIQPAMPPNTDVVEGPYSQ